MPKTYNNKYFKNPVVRVIFYTIRKEFPGCIIGFHEDPNGIGIMSFSFTNEQRKEYKLSENYREFSLLNDRLTGNTPLNPFSFDPLTKRISDIELDMDVEKKKKYSINTRRAIESASEFIETAYINTGSFSKGTYISFDLNDEKRFYYRPNDEQRSHLIKITEDIDISDTALVRFSDLEPSLKFEIIHTAFPGINVKAVEYLCGIRGDKPYWKDAEEAYKKEYHKKLYEKLNLRPLDIVYDANDIICVGEFAENKMRRLVLVNGDSYAYNFTRNWVGEEVLNIKPFEEYEKERDEIINSYKKDIMYVYRMTGIVPAIAIDLMNKSKDPGSFVLMNKDEAVRMIRLENLKDPLNAINNKLNKLIIAENKQNSISINFRGELDGMQRKGMVNLYGKQIKVDVDLEKLTVSDPYTGGMGLEKPFEIKDEFGKTLFGSLRSAVSGLKDSDEYKCFLFTYRLKEQGIEHRETAGENKIEYIFSLGNIPLYFDPYEKTLSMGNGEMTDGENDLLEYVKTIYQEIY